MGKFSKTLKKNSEFMWAAVMKLKEWPMFKEI